MKALRHGKSKACWQTSMRVLCRLPTLQSAPGCPQLSTGSRPPDRPAGASAEARRQLDFHAEWRRRLCGLRLHGASCTGVTMKSSPRRHLLQPNNTLLVMNVISLLHRDGAIAEDVDPSLSKT